MVESTPGISSRLPTILPDYPLIPQCQSSGPHGLVKRPSQFHLPSLARPGVVAYCSSRWSPVAAFTSIIEKATLAQKLLYPPRQVQLAR